MKCDVGQIRLEIFLRLVVVGLGLGKKKNDTRSLLPCNLGCFEFFVSLEGDLETKDS